MSQRRVTDATMRIRDYLYEGLLLRVPEEVARERANNLAMGVIETLRQMAEEAKASEEPPPVRSAGRVARHLEDIETMDEHAERVIK